MECIIFFNESELGMFLKDKITCRRECGRIKSYEAREIYLNNRKSMWHMNINDDNDYHMIYS